MMTKKFVLFCFLCCIAVLVPNTVIAEGIQFSLTEGIDNAVDEIKVVRHLVNHNFYGVTLRHGWTCDLYHDSGYLFMLWDFTNEDSPQIQLTTWQPDMIDGKPLPEEEVFSLKDFEL